MSEMTDFVCKLAGTPIGVRALFPETRRFLHDYLTDNDAVLRLTITPEDISCERRISDRAATDEGRPILPWPETYLETLALCRKVADILVQYDTLLFHGSAIAVDGEAYLFTAPSGTGKSTHTRLWRELLGKRAFMVNDDKPFLKLAQNGFEVYGNPWDGKHHLSRNVRVPLRAVCLLEQAKDNRIEPVSPSELYPSLLGQTYRPRLPEAMARVLKLTDRLVSAAQLYRLGCNMKPEAARIAYVAMHGPDCEISHD